MRLWKAWLLVLLFPVMLAQSGSCGEAFAPESKLTLQDCVAVALANQPDLLAAKENVLALLAKVGAARSAYWPRIGFDTDYFRGNYISVTGPAQSVLTGVFTTYISQFSATVTLEDFGRRHAIVGEAGAELAEAEARFHRIRSGVIFRVARAYFMFLEAQAFLKVSRDALTAAEKHLELAKGFVKTGEESEIALAKAMVVYSDAEFNDLKAAHDVEETKANLNEAMGLSHPPPYTITEQAIPARLNLDLMQAKAMAFRLRPDLLAAEARVDAAKARANRLRAERWPVLSGNAGYGWIDEAFPPQIKIWQLGLSLEWPLFDGNRVGNEIREADALEKAREEEERALRLQIDNEVERDFRAIDEARAQLDVAGSEVAYAEKNEKLALARYKEGLGSPVELSDAEADLARALAHKLRAEVDRRIAQSALKRAVGIEEP